MKLETSLLRRLCAFMASAIASFAIAGTNVGGPINVNTTWAAAGGPYTVTSDVTIGAGATLTIDAGVTVFMTPGTNLVVASGALSAQGTSPAPIVITSSRDIVNPNPAPAPGDWGQLQFAGGTISGATLLDYVEIRFGSGVAIAGASPTLNHVSLQNNLGPAIAVDLASSPVGSGLAATGNTINGILVPPGDILGDVVWGLTGIPYVVSQGVVGVGAAQVPMSISVPANLLVAPGSTAPLQVTLSAAAPAGGVAVTLASGSTALATVTSPVNVAAGATTANATVTGVAVGNTSITASAAGYAQGVTAVAVRAIALDILPSGTINVPQGVAQSYLATMSQSSPVAVTVSLATNNPTFATVSPGTVTFAPNQTTAPFSVQGVATGSTALTLSSPGLVTKSINVNVLGQGNLVFNHATVIVGKSLEIPTIISKYTVTLKAGGVDFSNPVPVTVSLASGDPAKVDVPASVVIPSFGNSAAINIRGLDITSAPVNITASSPGYQTTPTPLAATVVAPQFTFLGLDGNRVTTGPRDDFQLYWIVPDPVNPAQGPWVGIPVDLTITNQNPAGIVSGFYDSASGGNLISQTIMPAGSQGGGGAYIERPTIAGSYTVTASVPGVASSTSSVQSVTSPILQLAPSYRISAGLTSLGNAVKVTRTGDLSSAVTVSLTCTPSTFCSVPNSIVLPASAASMSIAMTGVAPGLSTLTASSAGYVSASSPVTVVTPTFSFSASAGSIPIGGTINLSVSLGGGGEVISFSPTDVVVSLTNSTPSVASVPGSVTIPAGASSSAGVQMLGLSVGSFTVTASSAGYQPVTTFAFDVTPPPVLTLVPATGFVGLGAALPITVQSNLTVLGGLVVQLSSSNSGFVSIPVSTVTIPPGGTSVQFPAIGVAAGTATLTAHATGYADGTASITAGSQALSLPAATLVAHGAVRTLTVTLSTPAPAGGLVISLVSSNISVVSVVSSTVALAGASSATFDISGVGYGGSVITASAPGYQSATVNASSLDMRIALQPSGDINIPTGGPVQTYQVTLESLTSSVPPVDVVVDLQMADPSVAAISPTSVVVPKFQNVAATTVDVTPLLKGATTLNVSSPGLGITVVNVNVIDPPNLVFDQTVATLGKGMDGWVTMELRSNGAPYYSPLPLTVNLSSSDPGKVGVPATLVVPAFNQSFVIHLQGLDFTAGAVTVDASITGFMPPSPKLAVTVLAPQITFNGLDDVRIVASGRDNFFLSIAPPGGPSAISNTLVSDAAVDLTVTSAAPSGIVGGFFNQATGGSAITQVTILASSGASGAAFVGQPTAPGTYTITASIPGIASATSSVQTVASVDALQFDYTDFVLGKGLSIGGLILRRTADGNDFAGSDPLVVNLVSSDPSKVSVPASVTIPAGQYAVTFAIKGVDLTASPVTIDAIAVGYIAPATKLTVTVAPPQLQILGLDTFRTIDSAGDSFGVYWFVPGNTIGGYQYSDTVTTIDVAVTNATPPGIVAGIFDDFPNGNAVTQLTIPAGWVGSNQGFVGQPTGTSGTYFITATVPGVATVTSDVQTVVSDAPLLSFATTYAAVGVGLTTPDDGQMGIYASVDGWPFFPAVPVDVTLTNSDPATLELPATVTLWSAFASGVSFTMTGLQFGNVSVSASAPGFTFDAPLGVQVVYPTLEFQFATSPPAVQVGQPLDFYLNIAVPGGYPNGQTPVSVVIISLAAADSNVLSIPPGALYIYPGSVQTLAEIVGQAVGASTVSAFATNFAFSASEPITVTP